MTRLAVVYVLYVQILQLGSTCKALGIDVGDDISTELRQRLQRMSESLLQLPQHLYLNGITLNAPFGLGPVRSQNDETYEGLYAATAPVALKCLRVIRVGNDFVETEKANKEVHLFDFTC